MSKLVKIRNTSNDLRMTLYTSNYDQTLAGYCTSYNFPFFESPLCCWLYQRSSLGVYSFFWGWGWNCCLFSEEMSFELYLSYGPFLTKTKRQHIIQNLKYHNSLCSFGRDASLEYKSFGSAAAVYFHSCHSSRNSICWGRSGLRMFRDTVAVSSLVADAQCLLCREWFASGF